ncbi:NAD(P)-dependent alcohol dehydrogenase [Halobacillus litoralis]|uniref:NAD(P)-dependent alcohol dehydrogenase n=1 Tax=Halobacillus litoralis TaxID=45668 RepID=UPI001CD1AE80|nr:NAD(P)-dependent alcohol dehydrogenase [Halobacillus litoralis]MCA0970680.1 NAD(P)-dependent alcohol dehydrogenase [Halobacillus litoralis]
MRAIVYTKRKHPDVLQVSMVNTPSPKSNEVLIKVHATTVTSGDVAKLYLFNGLLTRNGTIPGQEVAGEIVAVGKDVQAFKAGDEVLGITTSGAQAEFVCLPEDAPLTLKPEGLSYEEAASISFGGSAALYFLSEMANIQKGDAVLINGASGGVGTFAVQVAKYFRAHVTGVCSTGNVEKVKALGADRVIDYTTTSVIKADETYDIIFDAVGKLQFKTSKNALRKKGVFVSTSFSLPLLIQKWWTSKLTDKKVRIGVVPNNANRLDTLKGLIQEGKLRSVIDRVYTLERTPEAYQYVAKGHKTGNVVIKMDHS